MDIENKQSEAAPVGRRASRRGDDGGNAQTKTLAALVAVMVVAGVVALIMTLVGNNGSGSSQAGAQPANSQVGDQSSTSATTGAPSSTAPATVAPTTSAPAVSTPVVSTPAAPAPVTSKPATSKPATPMGTAVKKVVYTVKKGDNLTVIASWFDQRGYGSVYDWNKSVIGKNPNLIHPGQKIIVSLKGDHMKVSTSSSK